MGLLDALLIAGAGAARGYRGSQEAHRQLSEAKRKALLEEREAQRQERALALQEALGASEQILRGAQGEKLKEETLGLTGARERALEPSPRIPGLDTGNLSRGDVDQYSDIFGDLIRERGADRRNTQDINARITNPTAFGGGRRSYLEPEDDALLRLGLDLQQPIPDIVALDPVKAAQFRKTQRQELFDLLKRSPRFAKLLSDSTDTSGKSKRRPSTKGR